MIKIGALINIEFYNFIKNFNKIWTKNRKQINRSKSS